MLKEPKRNKARATRATTAVSIVSTDRCISPDHAQSAGLWGFPNPPSLNRDIRGLMNAMPGRHLPRENRRFPGAFAEFPMARGIAQTGQQVRLTIAQLPRPDSKLMPRIDCS